MESESYFLIGLLLLVIPLFFWYRVRTFNKQKHTIAVKCRACGAIQRIGELANYTCKKCSSHIQFMDEQGVVLDSLAHYQCVACGQENPKGVLTCIGCGLANAEQLST